MQDIQTLYHSCHLCPRNCGVDRSRITGFCGAGDRLRIARAALHEWEEPCISAGPGSGTIFFSSCSLRCRYCQNFEIAEKHEGAQISHKRLAQIYLELQEAGAANINLVTAAHYVPHVIAAFDLAYEQGFNLPVVYNSSGYESLETLDMLRGYVDVYLCDYKYESTELSSRYSRAPEYPQVVKAALARMYDQVGEPVFDESEQFGLRLTRGIVVRHLLLPGALEDSKQIVSYLWHTYQDKILLSLMNQYTPLRRFEDFPELNTSVSPADYETLLDFADELGCEDYFWQEGGANKESFVPFFNKTGVFGKEIS